MYRIQDIHGREILDSRGRPTVEACCVLESGAVGVCSVPSGASTGSAEAVELRDGDRQRYEGFGCRRAAAGIGGEIRNAVIGRSFGDSPTPALTGDGEFCQRSFDDCLVKLDGSSDKSRLGANAVLASSLAYARAVAAERRLPFYRHLADIAGRSLEAMPQLTINLFSGGKHAGGQVPVQDVLMVPLGAATVDESLAVAFSVYQSASRLILRKYGMRTLRADEGGLAPLFPDAETMLADSVEAIYEAGLRPGLDVALAVDVASTHFFRDGVYNWSDRPLTSRQMIDQLDNWVQRFPIVSLEDGLSEDDWDAWPLLCERLGNAVMILGDDLLCTNSVRIRRAVAVRAANSLLLKVNQIGTVTEACDAMQLARRADWRITVSARSGETEDNWLADLAVGWGGHQIKVGSITQSERLAKYNRLLAIESETQLPPASPVRVRDGYQFNGP